MGFIVGGISAGGSMAAAVSHFYRDEKQLPPLSGIYLSIPSLLAPEAVPEKHQAEYLSRQQFREGLVINEKAMKLFRSTIRNDARFIRANN
jgi:acetyl esterase/lipase